MKKLTLGSLLAIVLLLMIPNGMLMLRSSHASNFYWIISALLVPPILLSVYFAAFSRKLWLGILLLVPFAALVPLVTFYTNQFGTPVSEAIIGTVTATNQGEADQFFGPWFWPLVALTVACLLLVCALSWLTFRRPWQIPLSSRLKSTLAIVAAGLVVALLAVYSFQRATDKYASTNRRPLLQSVAAAVQIGYPFGLLVSLEKTWQSARELQAAVARIKHFRFHPYKSPSTGPRHIYVLVVGESSRRDHWQMFGYARPTNPELTKTANLVPITHMISAWPLSIGGITTMLTRKPLTSGLDDAFDEPSIVELMHEGGYQTWWLSNQSPTGQNNSPITVYATEADHLQWMPMHKHDDDLAMALDKVLRHSEGNLFIVLHMMGSHWAYDGRYPAQFKTFTPTMHDGGRFDSNYSDITNSYDNTVVYTDHVLARIIGELRASEAVTALWYESDHGETLPTATCPVTQHGHGFRDEFPIPAFFWYSAAYADEFPDRVATLRQNADKLTTDGDTFSTVADMAGIDFPKSAHERSLFSKTWRYRPRIIHPDWQVGNSSLNYEGARLGNGCELVRKH